MSIDQRTRTDGPRTPLEADAFFGDELPALLREREALLQPGVRWLSPRPLLVEVEARRWTLTANGGRVDVHGGAQAGAAHVRLSAEQLDNLVDDQRTFIGFHSSGRLDQPAGTLADLNDWWLVLRAALDDRAIHTPGGMEFAARDGGRLDLRRVFRPDDDPDEMRHALEQAGYLRIAGLFSATEMDAIAADMDRAAPTYTAGDGRSWWARTANGEHRVVRMQGFDQHSPTTASLLRDRRFLAFADIPGDGHAADLRRADNRIEALFKPIGIVEGISDVPWHKDCGLGRHSYDCSSITVGISVTGADARSGQLRVVAGSHRALVWPARQRPGSDLPEIDLPTECGDVTIHCSCTSHMAQPPIERERRVLYTTFSLPPRTAAAADARARLRIEVREAAPVMVSQPPSPVR
ncbi:MAG: phytanoyl-CoA dioxygenase family protein [bacterium]